VQSKKFLRYSSYRLNESFQHCCLLLSSIFSARCTGSLSHEQKAQLSQRDCAFLPVIEYFAKSVKIIHHHRMWHPWVGRNVSLSLLLFHCKCLCILYRFWEIQRQTMAVPWNLGYGWFKITKNGAIRLSLLSVSHCDYSSLLYHFRDRARDWSKIAIFTHFPAFDVHVRGGPC